VGAVTKEYTFLKNITADASEVNKNFDILFTEINGELNSANIVNTYTPAASQVTIEDTASNYAASNVEEALAEVGQASSITINDTSSNVNSTKVDDAIFEAAYKGYNSIGVVTQVSHGILVYPGIVEVNGTICRNTATLYITAVSLESGTISTDTLYAVTVQSESSIQESSIQLVPIDQISASNGVDLYKNGFYHSNTRRVIATVWNNATAGGEMRLFPHQFLGQLSTHFSVKWSADSDQSSIVNFCGELTSSTPYISSTGDGRFHEFKLEYSKDRDRLVYSIRGTPSHSAALINFALPQVYGRQFTPAGGHEYNITYFNYFDPASTGHYYNSPHYISGSGYVFHAYFSVPTSIYHPQKLYVRYWSGGESADGEFNIRIEPSPFLGEVDIR
jgi:hypothetical protein